MSVQMILLPLFAQVALTLVVMFTMAARRFGAIRGGKLRGPIGLREANWPDDARKAEYNYQNQFELPVLFYVLMILLFITKQADLLMILLAWVFVALRVFHAFVHVTSNDVKFRGPFFILGALVLTGMWIVYAMRIYLLP